MNFKSIDYLKNGKQLQKEAYEVLAENKVMEKLANFHPLLVGTIPIDIAIEGSDLDIVCSFEEAEVFTQEIHEQFSAYPQFSIVEKTFQDEPTIIVCFKLEEFPVEIFAQKKPSNEQIAYQHMLIEHQILIENEGKFREKILRLKKSGVKTEPAIAQILNLDGDPYQALLKYGKQKGFI